MLKKGYDNQVLQQIAYGYYACENVVNSRVVSALVRGEKAFITVTIHTDEG